MSNKRRYSRHLRNMQVAELAAEPQGFYLIEDHGMIVSCVRYFNDAEKMEILMLSSMAQAECKTKHTNKAGICCRLIPTDLKTWREYH